MGFLEIEGLGKIRYHEYGSGEKLLFAFHGYGMLGSQFKVLEKSVLKEFKVVAFDHFFHGETQLANASEAYILPGLQPQLLNAYVENWFKQFGRQRFSLLGYSIGATMALFLLENFAELVDEVLLLAPDGLQTHRGLHFLRASFIGKKLFRKLTFSSWMMVAMLKLIKKIKVIDHSLYVIASREIDTPQKRLNAYFTVNFNKNIRPDIKKIATLINRYQIRCRLYFGEFDYLFPASNSKKLLGLLDKPEIYILPLGHWLITSELDNYIARQTHDQQQQAPVIL